jgi:uncharacterized protein
MKLTSTTLWRHLALTLVSTLVLSSGAAAQGAADGPNPRLPMVGVQAGMHLLKAEVASDPGTRAKGLMHRTKLGVNEGMLFIFERKGQHCFWMRNTLIPLSIAFIDDDGIVSNIEAMSPKSDDSHCPLKAVRYALEMDQGWFAKKGITPGAKLVAKDIFGAKP